MARFHWRTAMLSFLIAALLFLIPVAASGEDAPTVRDRKGIAPAEGPWLDRSGFEDGSQYENPPTDVKVVRIGLKYAETAVEIADFENSLGNGFRIGVYNWDREFVEFARTDCSLLTILCSDDPAEGLLILGGEDQTPVYRSGANVTVAIEPIAGQTIYNDRHYLGGFECCITYDSRMIVVNCVGLEDYVMGVIPYEMAKGWPKEALKAQAVCARTYVVYNLNQYEEYGFDLTDDTYCQVYKGTDGANWWTDEAVEETEGELIRYKGEICRIYYSAADGGATEDGRYMFDADLPYLQGKLDPFEAAVDYSYKSWSYSLYGVNISARLRMQRYEIGTVVKILPEYTELGNVIALTFEDEEGVRVRVEGRDCYSILGLPSIHFQITQEDTRFTFEGSGLGHSCGMSQWGAKAMDETYGYDYQYIIQFYFTGAYVA